MIAFLFAILTIAQASAPPEQLPVDTYKRAIAAMRNIHDPSYLQFGLDERFTHGSKVVTFLGDEIEQTQDHGAYLRLNSDLTAKPKHLVLPVPPDLFLNNIVVVTPPDDGSQLVSGLDNVETPLKTIAKVQAISVHYSIESLPSEDAAGCSAAVHLKLTPTTDPLRYNLRELWINPMSFQICRAIAVWRAPMMGHMQDTLVTLDLDGNGFVDHWQLTSTAKMLLGTYTMQQEVSYKNVQPADAVSWSTFGGN